MKKAVGTSENSLQLPIFTNKNKAVKLIEIAWLEADSNYTTFHFANGEKVMVSRTMKEYMGILSDKLFVRTHKSFAVNLRHIIRYDVKDEMIVMLHGGNRIAISRRKKKQFVATIQATFGRFWIPE